MFIYPFKLIKPLHIIGFIVLSIIVPFLILEEGSDSNIFLLARYFPLYVCPIFFIYLNRKVGILNREQELLIQRVGKDRFHIMSTIAIIVEAVIFFIVFIAIRYFIGGLTTATFQKFGMLVLLRFVAFILGVSLIIQQLGKDFHIGYMLIAFLICIVSQFFLIEGVLYDYFLVL